MLHAYLKTHVYYFSTNLKCKCCYKYNLLKIIDFYLLDVESKSSAHEHWEFNKKHVPSKVIEGVGDHQGPEGDRGEDLLPGDSKFGRGLQKC